MEKSGMGTSYKNKGYCKLYGGILMALSASIFFSSSFLLIKILETRGVKGFGAALLLNLGILIPSLLAIVINEWGPGWRRRKRVLNGLIPLKENKMILFHVAVSRNF